jgi:actin-like protein 6A
LRAQYKPIDCATLQDKEKQATGLTADATLRGLSDLVFDGISASDVDLRRELFNNIILSGGLSNLQGVQMKLQSDLSARVPHGYKLKLISASPIERRFSSWVGGSILASLGSFHQIWISKAEYEEHGAKIVEKKCP